MAETRTEYKRTAKDKIHSTILQGTVQKVEGTLERERGEGERERGERQTKREREREKKISA